MNNSPGISKCLLIAIPSPRKSNISHEIYLKSDKNILTPEDLLKELKEKTISCKDVTFKILGFSLATLNTIISLGISIIILRIYLNYEKK